jgi:hypothetical protein
MTTTIRANSIQAMKSGLADAVARHDWESALRHVTRLKAIIIDSLVRDDAEAVHGAGATLQMMGEILELTGDLPMAMDATAFAWRLRADVEFATLAAAVRPR